MSTTQPAVFPLQAPASSDSRAAAGATEREHLLDRLAHLRAILPAFAEELAAARRQSAALRVENRGLVDEVRRLRHQRGDSAHARSTRPRTQTDQRRNLR
ncbi:MAG: hypothetical protein ACRDJ3_05085 [Solirubrobacteraceae bacterium]